MNMNIYELHQRFCTERKVIKNYTDATIRWYKNTFNTFLNQCPVKIGDVTDINTRILEEYLYNGRIHKHWTSETFICKYKGLKSFFDWCVKKGIILVNPLQGIELPKVENKLPKRISKEEAIRLLEYSFYKRYRYRFERYRNRAIIALYIYTGIRNRELLNLKLVDVQLEDNTLQVKLGKGNKDRVIPICYKLKCILSEYITDRNRLNRECISFFTSTTSDTELTERALRKIVYKLKTGANINFSPHRLRHTFATLMLEGGCDLFSLQKMMGHSDIKTTSIYLSASVKHLQDQIIKHPLG